MLYGLAMKPGNQGPTKIQKNHEIGPSRTYHDAADEKYFPTKILSICQQILLNIINISCQYFCQYYRMSNKSFQSYVCISPSAS